MVRRSPTSRRAVLETTGAALGAVAMGGVTFAASRAPGDGAPAVDWQRRYDLDLGNSYGTAGRDVLRTSDGGYTVAANGSVLLRLDREGRLQWHTTAGGHVYALRRANDGGYVMVGRGDPHPGSGDGARIVKTDSAGEVVWERTLGASDAFLADVVRRPGHGYVAVGENDDAWLLAVAEDGTVAADRTYVASEERGSDEGNTVFHSVVRGSDGGYVAGGGEQADGVGWLLAVDDAFEPRWEKNFESNAFVSEIVHDGDGGYAVTASRATDDFLLATVTAAGDHVFTERYGLDGRDENAHGLLRTDEGYVLYGNREGDRTPWLVGTDADGTERWRRTVHETGWAPDQPNAIAATDDGGFVTVSTDTDDVENMPVVTVFSGGDPDTPGETRSPTAAGTGTGDDGEAATATTTPGDTADGGTETSGDASPGDDCSI